MKILYISLTAFIVLILRCCEPWRSSCAQTEDDFRVFGFAVLPCALCALVFAETHSGHNLQRQITEVLWEFSIYLEAVAILPQLSVLRFKGECDSTMLVYLILRGSYRALYIINWIERRKTEKWYTIDYSALVAAVIQTVPFLIYFATL